MRGVFVALIAVCAGCSFEHGVTPDGDGGASDTPQNDASIACTPGVLDLCALEPPTQSLTIASADTINTDTDARCRTLEQAGGGPVCLVYATTVTITASGSLTATGSRPLALAATSALVVAGSVDVSSRRGGARGAGANDGACAFAANPDADTGGGGGGAGGSFGGIGGVGGTGDADNSQGIDGTAAGGMPGTVVALGVLRGGCRGQAGGNEEPSGGLGGAGGDSGGALYLHARQMVQLSGTLRATGAGGAGGLVQAGGGGGGSGGLVVIESPTIMITGSISANGGGGGEGGARVMAAPVEGKPGADGTVGTTPAAGGMGTDNRLGAGGAGGAGATSATAGEMSIVGGGGGGGGVGFIRLVGTASGSGVISPPPV